VLAPRVAVEFAFFPHPNSSFNFPPDCDRDRVSKEPFQTFVSLHDLWMDAGCIHLIKFNVVIGEEPRVIG